MVKLALQEFYDKDTNTLSYIVWDSETHDGVVIDPVLDFDHVNQKLGQQSLKRLQHYIQDRGLKVRAILETHAHADHVSGAQALKEELSGVPVAIGEHIGKVQKLFQAYFDLGRDFPNEGQQFERLLKDGETWHCGSVPVQVFATPGHTPACCTYKIGHHVFTGDLLFMPDYGTGRCDFPGGSAGHMFDSITQKIYTLDDAVELHPGHDYQPGGRPMKFTATLREHKSSNIHLTAQTKREDFIKFRTDRDKTLSTPKLLWPSIRFNIDAGKIPAPRAGGQRILELPLFYSEN